MVQHSYEFVLTDNNMFAREDTEKYEQEHSVIEVENDGCVNYIKTFLNKEPFKRIINIIKD